MFLGRSSERSAEIYPPFSNIYECWRCLFGLIYALTNLSTDTGGTKKFTMSACISCVVVVFPDKSCRLPNLRKRLVSYSNVALSLGRLHSLRGKCPTSFSFVNYTYIDMQCSAKSFLSGRGRPLGRRRFRNLFRRRPPRADRIWFGRSPFAVPLLTFEIRNRCVCLGTNMFR